EEESEGERAEGAGAGKDKEGGKEEKAGGKRVKRGKRPIPKHQKPFRSWIDKPDKGEILVPNLQAYESFFPMNVEWPVLSFDFFEKATGPRNWPAATADENRVEVMEVTGLLRFRKRVTGLRRFRKRVQGQKGEDDSSESSNYEDAIKGVKDDAAADWFRRNVVGVSVLDFRNPAKPQLAASYPYGARTHGEVCASGMDAYASGGAPRTHQVEGYALAWSFLDKGTLAVGDVEGRVSVLGVPLPYDRAYTRKPRILEVQQGAVRVGMHHGSVEDLAFSPVQVGVLASCSSDRSIRFWDASGNGDDAPLIEVLDAHAGDVNCLDWSRLQPNLLLSAGEEGSVKVWDVGTAIKRGSRAPMAVAVFAWHKAAIASVHWHPTDAPVILAACRDGYCSIWDLSVERDESAKELESKHGLEGLPPQLLFLHQGQTEVAEARWHPHVASLVVSTAADGFHFWKPSTL
ncbi:WD40-repeat-containing domain protein, partial [Baffinella frigidus]